MDNACQKEKNNHISTNGSTELNTAHHRVNLITRRHRVIPLRVYGLMCRGVISIDIHVINCYVID